VEEHRGTVEPLPETGCREDKRGVPFHVEINIATSTFTLVIGIFQ
jgi:hypothetical protein